MLIEWKLMLKPSNHLQTMGIERLGHRRDYFTLILTVINHWFFNYWYYITRDWGFDGDWMEVLPAKNRTYHWNHGLLLGNRSHHGFITINNLTVVMVWWFKEGLSWWLSQPKMAGFTLILTIDYCQIESTVIVGC